MSSSSSQQWGVPPPQHPGYPKPLPQPGPSSSGARPVSEYAPAPPQAKSFRAPQQQTVNQQNLPYHSPVQSASIPYQGPSSSSYAHPQQVNPRIPPPQAPYQNQWDDSASESDGTVVEDTPEARAGPAFRGGRQQDADGKSLRDGSSANPNVPGMSYALLDENGERTNKGNTKFVMAFLAEAWIMHVVIILGATYAFTFHIWDYTYTDAELWNFTCYWKLGWLLPIPYTLICFFGLALPFRTPKFIYDSDMPKRRVDNLYILTVTKGDNREAVYRSWNAHKHLERLHPCVRVHVLTDEPYFFENINCYTCPKNFRTANSKYKARALEWYRQTMRYTEHDWVLHLDEESVIDDESVKRVLEFIWYERECTWGQGVIMYNQYRYWSNWIFTVADAIRVGDDLSRFHLQYTYFRRPVFGAHGSFLLSNGQVENSITWDLGSLTEDFQFAVHAWEMGYKCGKVPGIIREQSPLDLIGFLKQRRRWYVGIRRLPAFLPKLWATFWTLGIVCLATTIASIPLGIVYKGLLTPRWFGLIKDFSFCVFVYLYLIGILVQDMDKRVNPLIMLARIPLTFLLQFIAGIMEALAVIYGIILPPADFDVIKK
ncbi:glycosyl transferase family group 2-domain-containing protein [Fimicolochytrium jonesii]|uniref:glycosyl transferase family group 2-domain-containing protein n=1 Tax=Fimicolochytrium jonesii TaxID=1396493 RepID=UPI0022FE265F|nr:glycosyl transferase family group 2-domain-containing protein [Fimicolochytrium jonesii]KAI8818646.1 glycosyl transferase family group 2-domain-containing protein [Fimicolochytrium jonesii]